MNLKGKTAIVTGSTMGIGRAIARHLAQAGAKVVLNGRNKDRLKRTLSSFAREGLTVSVCPGDVSNTEDCRKLIAHALEEFGGLDILVNNVGIGYKGYFEETKPEVFRQMVDTNVLGSVYPTIEALPHIKASKGSIVFISSLAGLRGMPFKGIYSLTKMAQTSLAESLRYELGKEGVHIGIVYVSTTRNDPEKMLLSADGTLGATPKNNGIFIDTQDDAAIATLKNIKNRQFKTAIGIKGKVYYFLQQYMPWFVDYTFRISTNYIARKSSVTQLISSKPTPAESDRRTPQIEPGYQFHDLE
jgi:NAD(P)-dependent dehydrogenase (short-subunit alcohol dehydrogenase family)